jgi:ADP-heptose:LPS heptosyltransferase
MTDLESYRDQPVSVLVVKLSSLGDVIHASGALRAIRQTLPLARISLVIESRWRDVVCHNPHLDFLIESSAQDRLSIAYLTEIWRSLAGSAPYDIAIDLQGNRRSAAWVYLSRAGVKVGRGRFRPGWRRAVEPDLTQHAVTVCAEICRSIGVEVSDPAPEIHTGALEEKQLDQVLADEGLPTDGYIVLNPFSRWPSKSWPLNTAAEVIRRLQKVTAYPLVLSGGPEDRERAAVLQHLLDPSALPSLVGRLSLGGALCLFRRGRLMVSCDSGPMHAAAAFGVPTIALFGPTHPARTGPWGAGHRVLQAKLPPTHRTYRNDPEGTYMRLLDAEVIVESVLSELSKGDSR